MARIGLQQELLGDVSIGYSGGLDSTTVAVLAARQGKGAVHLHTLRHGYGYLFYWWVGRTLPSLRRALGPDRVFHRYVNTRDLFRAIALQPLLADRRRYGQGFGCCLGCTLAIVTKMVIYNLERNIPHIMFGSSVGGEYAVMSMPVTVERLRAFCARYGILYSAPLLENRIVKADERALLDELGVYRGVRFLNKHSFANQGYCLLSLQHLPDVLFNVHPVYRPENVRAFIEDRLPACDRYIESAFAGRERELGGAVDALKRVTARESAA